MRPRTRTESRLLWIAIAGLWINALYWALSMIASARLAQTYHGYRYRHGAPEHWTIPTDEVATWVCTIAVEALFASVLLRRVTGNPAGLCLAVGALYGMAAFVMVPLSMHAPATFATHAIALLFAAGWLIAMGLAAALVLLAVRFPGAAPRPDVGLPEVRVVTGAAAAKR